MSTMIRSICLLLILAPLIAAAQTTVSVTAIDAEAAELGQDVAIFRFTRTGSTANALSVSTTDDPTTTAVVADYTDNNGGQFRSFRSVTIAAGQSFFDLVLTPALDNRVEGEEQLDISLASGSYVIGSPSSAGMTIADDPPVVTLATIDGDAAEAGQDPATFRFERSGGNIAQALSVSTTDDPTTTAVVADYTDNNGGQFRSFRSVTIAAGQSFFDLVLTPALDNRVEGEEQLDISLASGSYVIGSPSSAGMTIADDPPVVTLATIDGDAAEAGQDPATFRFERSGGNIAQALSVSTTDDPTTTAVVADYTDNNGGQFRSFRSVTLAAGQSFFDLVLTPALDNRVEGEERLDISLASGSYVIGSPSSAGMTIADDPPVVTLVATDEDSAEAGQDPATFRFERSGGNIAQALSVSTTDDPTTTAVVADYTDNNGGQFRSFRSVTLAAGQSFFDLVLTPALDNRVEGEEQLDISLASGSYVIGSPSSAGMTIADDPPVVTLVATDDIAVESGDPATFRFERNGGNIAQTLGVSTTDDPTTTAVVADYTDNNGGQFRSFRSVTIAAGQTFFDLEISAVLDNLVEGDEQLDITIATGGYVIGDPASAGIVLRDSFLFDDRFEQP